MLGMDKTLLAQLEMKEIGSMQTRLRFHMPLNTMIMSNLFVHWCQRGSETRSDKKWWDASDMDERSDKEWRDASDMDEIRSDEMQMKSEMQVIWIIFLSIDAKGGMK
jgi:hypothetical protein